MTARSLRFRRALFLFMSVLLLAGSVAHGHSHHDEPQINMEQQAGSFVVEHCSLCDLFYQPTEPLASDGRTVRTITVAGATTEKSLAVLTGSAGRVNDRGPPLPT